MRNKKLLFAFLDLSNLRIEPSLSPTEGEIVTLWPFQTRKLGLTEGTTSVQCSGPLTLCSASAVWNCCSDHSKVVKWEIGGVWAEFDRGGHLPSTSVPWVFVRLERAAEKQNNIMISCTRQEMGEPSTILVSAKVWKYIFLHFFTCADSGPAHSELKTNDINLNTSLLGPAKLVDQLGLALVVNRERAGDSYLGLSQDWRAGDRALDIEW